MRCLNLKLLGCLLCSCTLSVHGDNRSIVINQTSQKIAVSWTARGCLHQVFQYDRVCAGRIMNPGQSHRYQYDWGTTNDSLHIGGYFESVNRYVVAGGNMSFNTGCGRLIQGVGGNCQLPAPDGQVVFVKSITIDENNWSVDCQYEVRQLDNITDSLFVLDFYHPEE